MYIDAKPIEIEEFSRFFSAYLKVAYQLYRTSEYQSNLM